MAADIPAQPPPDNPCCTPWKLKCAEIKKKRDFLRQAVGILQPELEKAQTEINRLKKEYQEERAKVDAEKETKEKEVATRVSLENEVSDLKSEMFLLQQRYEQDLRDRDEEAKLLQDQVSGGKKEINQLKELLGKEKIMPDNAEEEGTKAKRESKKVKAEKANDEKAKLLQARFSEGQKEIRQLKKLVDKEKRRADAESSRAESEKKKAEDYLAQLEVLRQEVDPTNSELISMTSKFGKVSKQLEAEKKKTMKQRKRAESLSAIAEEQKKLAEQSMKKADEEKSCAESLSQQLEAAKQGIEELQKERKNQKGISSKEHAEDMVQVEEQRSLVEAHKMAMEEKSRGDDLAQQLREARLKIEDLQKQVDELLSSGKSVETSPVLDAGRSTIRILKKELKFEKMRVKHAKHAAKLEKLRKDVLAEELGRLKLEFVHFSNRLNLLDRCFSTDMGGTDDVVKVNSCRNMQQLYGPSRLNIQGDYECSNLRCEVVAAADPLKQAHQLSTLLIPRSGRQGSESISGTDPGLESLIGGSNKKLLQSSRINSSAASFSDGRSVASQGKGEFSVTTSVEIAEENLNVQQINSNMSGKGTNTGTNANVGLVDENNPRIRCGDVFGVVNENFRKRKGMLEAVESIEYLYSEERKLHAQIEEKLGFLHHTLARKRKRCLEDEKTSLTDLHGVTYKNHSGVYKKRKVSHGKNTVMKNVVEPQQPKEMKNLKSKICENPVIFGEPSQPACNLMGTVPVTGEKICDTTLSGHEAGFSCEEVTNADYMKLLELDKSEDEKYYKMAMEMPLSPSLPEIDFLDGETVRKNEVPTKSPSMMMNNGDNLCDAIQSSGPSILCAQNSEMAVDVSSMPKSRDELKSTRELILEYCVVFSHIKDRSSIARIFHATMECIELCSSVAQTERVVLESLLALKIKEHLLIKEKVCVLLSLLLYNFSVAGSGKVESCLNSISFHFLDSFAKHISSVIVGSEVQIMLAELLDELLNLLQDFLSDGRVLCSAVSSDMLNECDTRIIILLDGVNVVLSSRVASADQLVAGGVVLASICSAADRVEFICETSFDILHKHSHDTSVLLTILHVFAYLAGEKFFSVREYDLTMSVLKSIVIFLEKGHSPAAMEGGFYFHSLAKCPFSDGSASLDVVATLLLESIQEFAQIETMNQNLIRFPHSASLACLAKTEKRLGHGDVQCVLGTISDASSSLCTRGMHDTRPKAIDSGTLCQLCDVLSLLELVAGYMGWDQTSSHIVSPLLKILELPVAVEFSVAIVTVLGQLGSLGVNASGLEDRVVKDLREKLCAFLQQETTIQGGLPIQIASVSTLLRLLPLRFNEIIQGSAPNPSTLDLSVSIDLVQKWFSLLSEEQQAFSLGFLKLAHVVGG